MPLNRRWLCEIKPFICPSVLILFSRFFLMDVLPNRFYQDYLNNRPGFDPGVMSRCCVSAPFLISHGFLLPERAPTTAGAHFHTAPYYTLRNHFKGSPLYDRFSHGSCGLSLRPAISQQHQPNRGGTIERSTVHARPKKKHTMKEYPRLIRIQRGE